MQSPVLRNGRESQGTGQKDVRFIGDVLGSYVLASRAQTDTVQVFACRARSISAYEAVINAPIASEPGDAFTATFQGLGIVRGHITRLLEGGFAAAFDCTDDEREALGVRIDWLKKRTLKTVKERREHKRVLPRETRSKLLLGSGTVVDCFIIDMSQSGVAISAEVRPPVGTLAGVGAVPGKVVRHFEAGFALQFIEVQSMDQLEALLTLKTSRSKHIAAERLGFFGQISGQ